jgi:RND superfamily putative drug exporter
VLRRLATLIVSFPRRVLAVAVALLVLSAIFGAGVSEHLKVGGFDDPGSESAQAERFLEAEFGTASPNLVLQVTARRGDVNTPDVAAAAQQLRRSITSEPDITEVASYWVANSPELRSNDGRSALLLLHVGGNPEQAARRTHTLVEALPSDDPAIEVVAGGKLGLTDAIEQQVADDLLLAESIAVPATLVLLVVAFGSVVAALLPLTLGIISILATMVVLFGLAQITDVSVYALTVATAFGLGLAIDFGLLLVSRFREERAAGSGRRHGDDGRAHHRVQRRDSHGRDDRNAGVPHLLPTVGRSGRDGGGRRCGVGRRRGVTRAARCARNPGGPADGAPTKEDTGIRLAVLAANRGCRHP